MSNEILKSAFTCLIPDLDQWESLDDIGDGRFINVSWHELPQPEGEEIIIGGETIVINTFGLQRLDETNSRVLEHLEIYELVYPLVGDTASMNIRNTPNDIPVPHPMRGPIDNADELMGLTVSVLKDGDVRVGGTRIEPVITKAGQYHGTEGGPMVYLVIKGNLR